MNVDTFKPSSHFHLPQTHLSDCFEPELILSFLFISHTKSLFFQSLSELNFYDSAPQTLDHNQE